MDRRKFISSCLGSLGVSACSYSYRGEHPPGTRVEQKNGFLTEVNTLPEKKSTLIYAQRGFPILLLREGDKVWGFRSYCPHMACELNDGVSSQPLELSNNSIRCHIHDSYFDKHTGDRLSGPSPEGKPLPKVELEIKEGNVYLMS